MTKTQSVKTDTINGVKKVDRLINSGWKVIKSYGIANLVILEKKSE